MQLLRAQSNVASLRLRPLGAEVQNKNPQVERGISMEWIIVGAVVVIVFVIALAQSGKAELQKGYKVALEVYGDINDPSRLRRIIERQEAMAAANRALKKTDLALQLEGGACAAIVRMMEVGQMENHFASVSKLHRDVVMPEVLKLEKMFKVTGASRADIESVAENGLRDIKGMDQISSTVG